MHIKSIFFNIILIIIALCLPFIAGEVAYRTYHYFKFTAKGNSVQSLNLDQELGWRTTSGYVFKGVKLDSASTRYEVDIQTNDQGFQLYGNRDSSKVKIFFIGDSFTQAKAVSNNKTYYSLFTDRLPVESFAYGVGGYGTLQEYMILDKYIDEILPDIIVLQCSTNDFINNSYELESKSYINNNKMRRPYYNLENQVYYDLPKKFPNLRGLINEYSRFLHKIVGKLDHLIDAKKVSIERTIVAQQGELPAFKTSVRVTGNILKRIRDRARHSKVYAFCVDNQSPFYESYRSLAGEAGITFIDGISQAIQRAEKEGAIVRARDGAHWNELGHQIAADQLFGYFFSRL